MQFKNTLLLAAAASVAQAQTCAPSNAVKIFLARGTTEPQGGPHLEDVITSGIQQKLPGSTVTDITYPASFDLPSSANQGVTALTQELTAYVNACPNSKVVLLGYSQGAQIVGDVISGGGTKVPTGATTNPTPPISDDIMKSVIAIILFGDPGRVKDVPQNKLTCTSDATNPRTGAVLAKFNSYGARMQDYCDSGDPVCCGTGTNILAHLGYFNSANSDSVSSFVVSQFGGGASSGSSSAFPSLPSFSFPFKA